ncbi:diguanylate cyclase [Mycolicibacterium sp. 624]|uniref:sensor domain-containing diguanylate cyclase n=1 Tax=Mycolicibacterium sp. 624 TaxID=3156314 RepID=UPI0033917E6B
MWIPAVERIRSSRRATAGAAMVLALSYVLLGRLTFSVSVEHSNVTSVVFAPEGIALAFCILFGPRVAWGVFLGQTILSIWTGPSVLGGAGIGLVNSLEGILGAALFARWRISPQFARPRDVALFVALVFLILQPISATAGVSVLWGVGVTPANWIPSGWDAMWIHGIQRPISDPSQLPSAWVHWWIGNSLGQILVAPLLLAWATKGTWRRPDSRGDLLASALVIGLTGIAATVLPIHPVLVLGVTFPLLVLIGLRRGLRGVTTANVVITPAVLWAGTSAKRFLDQVSVPDRLAYVGFFVATAFILFSLMLFSMFEERRLLVERLARLARQDSLVPLDNRRHFVEQLEPLIQQATARGSPLAAITFDIDHFKLINDTNGHAAGDRVLIAVANTCKALLRDTDIAARIGGEEFAIVLPDTDIADAQRFADGLRSAIAVQHLVASDATVAAAITISVGVAALQPGDSLDDFLNRADAALYDAKRGGRDMVVVGR